MESSNQQAVNDFMDSAFGKEIEVTGTCETHGNWATIVREKQTSGRSCPHCAAEKKSAKERKEADDKAAAAAKRRTDDLIECGVSLRHMDKTFDAYIAQNQEQVNALAKARSLVESVAKDPRKVPSLIMCGKPGTGKTHLACAIAIAAYDAGVTVCRESVAGIIREFKDSWRKESEFDEMKLLRFYGTVKLLIIEEIGVQFGSDTERMYLFEVINRRYENCLPTVLVSNLDPDKLAAEVGERVMDRLREDGGRLIRFTGESWRKQ